jgi:DNA-binding CsgD family transcriptional regulator
MSSDNDTVPAEESQAFGIKKLRESQDFFAATFSLLNDDITGPQWLEKLATLANCRSITCLWWPADYPEKMIVEACGRELNLSNEQLSAIDKAITIAPAEPGLLDELLEKTGCGPSDHHDCLFRADQLIACIDWWPANVILIFDDRLDEPDWSQNDRQRVRDLLPTIRQSVTVKKRLSKLTDSIELTNKILDEFPRGFILLMPDSDILDANLFANRLIEKSPVFQLSDRNFRFRDREIQQDFQMQLKKIDALPKDQLNEFVWHKNLSGSAATGSLMATVLAFGFDTVRTESTRFDRVALIILEQQGYRGVAGEKQLREFYQLTKAQARLLHAIIQHNTIEEAATTLHISINTARSHLRAIYDRLGINNIGQLLQITNATLTTYNPPD